MTATVALMSGIFLLMCWGGCDLSCDTFLITAWRVLTVLWGFSYHSRVGVNCPVGLFSCEQEGVNCPVGFSPVNRRV